MNTNPLRRSFLQRALTSKLQKPTSEARKQSEVAGQGVALKRYISLKIYRENDTYLSPGSYLKPGQRYRMALQCDEDRIDDNQQAITINGPFRLRLKYRVEEGTCTFALPHEQNLLHFDGPFANTIETPFSLPQEDCSSCKMTIEVEFIAGEKKYGPITTHYALIIKGNANPENSQWLAAHYIAASVPKNIIVLSAEPVLPEQSSSKRCLLFAWNYYHHELFRAEIDTSLLINIAECIRDEKGAVDVLRCLKNFSSRSAGELVRWIREIKMQIENRGMQLSLVIFDATFCEIPWELLEIAEDEYLGAVAQVARWLPLEAYGDQYLLKIHEYSCKGTVVSYLDKHLEGTITERALLRQFEHNEIRSFEALKARLENGESLQDVGLLYIACHGREGARLYNSWASGSTSDLRASWLNDLVRSTGPRPTLFVNACESARILYKKDEYAYNLVRNFLLPCASNYIGTLANVNDQDAPEIARAILQLARENEGDQVVEILRSLRAKAVKDQLALRRKLKGQKETEDSWQLKEESSAKLLNTFLYVYYGNPLARLHLRPAQSELEGA